MRKSKKANPPIMLIVIAGLVLVTGARLVESSKVFLLLLLAAPIAIIMYKSANKRRRLKYLCSKYGDEEVVQRIIARELWRGQTLEQLCDSLGEPSAIDQKIMATRDRQVWKYDQKGANRFALRVTLDNEQVAGWEKR